MSINLKKLSDLHADPENSNISTQEKIEGLKISMEEYGDISGVVYNIRTNQLVCGHQRVEALKGKYGDLEIQSKGGDCLQIILTDNKTINIRLVDWSKEKQAEANLIANSTHLQGTLNPKFALKKFKMIQLPKMKMELLKLNDLKTDIDNIQPAEVKEEESKKANSVPELQKEAVIKSGDLIELGNHKLICGDCTIKENIERLMENEKADLLVTDPPYVQNYDPQWRLDLHKKHNPHGKIIEGDNDWNWLVFFDLMEIDILYIWMGALPFPMLFNYLTKLNYECKYELIWNKDFAVLGRGGYNWKHEPCYFFAKKGKKLNFQGDKSQNTVWDIPTINSFARGNKENWGLVGHGNQKPIECMQIPIENNSCKGNIILDPFLGSGTTIIACEKTNRKCYGLEIDPLYCDVIISRYCKFVENYDIKINSKEIKWKEDSGNE